MSRRITRVAQFGALLAASVAIAACVNDNVVYRDRALTVSAPPAGAGFVGYTDTATKQTACGNCHVEQQAKWATTKHASAWADLQASGHSSSACESCHAVSNLGNGVADSNVAYAATKDTRYTDVQCENCHGPGQQHVSTPAITNRPLASIQVDTGTKDINGCGQCHTGTHEPFVDEWKQTFAQGHAHLEAHALTSTDPTCVTCHTGQGALLKFNVNTAYKEKDQITTNPVAITCAVCHDPHAATVGKQLRFAIDTPDPTRNLCMQCHNRDSGPNPTSSRGPMTPETATLLGTAGWWPPNLTLVDTSAILATHGSSSNTRLCATCHVVRTAVNDPKTGSFVFQATGHNFAAIPCLDANGKPTTGDCAISQRTFTACAGSGCHASDVVGRSLYITDSLRIAALETTLSGQLGKAPASSLNYTSTTLTTAKGATWNLQVAQKPGAWIHNPFLIEALLTASIKQMTLDYGIAPSTSISLDNILRRRIR